MRLGPYQLLEELGAGGMGKVYRAEVVGHAPGLETGCQVALKVIHGHLLETSGFFQRFLREADIGRSVHHDNVVRTYLADALVQEGVQQNFLVMEYVEGQTLRDLLKELQQVPEELCRHIGREISKGLQAIHEKGAIHRDLKPENVLITPDHTVKIMDLGVARLMDEAIRLSQTGHFVGSLLYAAPESFHGKGGGVDGRADLHSLGLLLYELATGTHPYAHADLRGVLNLILHEVPRHASEANPLLSSLFDEVLCTLLAKDPDDRFDSAADLLAILEQGEDASWWESRSRARRAAARPAPLRLAVSRPTAVYGREQEFARLHGLYDRAKEGVGQVVILEGEAGIGKTRLIDELAQRLGEEGEDFFFLFGGYPPNGAATSTGAFQTAFAGHFGPEGCASHLSVSPVLARSFDAYMRGEPVREGETLTPESIGTCFVQATRALAAEKPTVVVIDDLHFASEEGRALLLTLALAVPGHRVLLIASHRPGMPQGWRAALTRLPQTTTLSLARLAPEDLQLMLSDALRSETAAVDLSDRIGDRSDGNPFFVLEILRSLREGGKLTQTSDGHWSASRHLVTADIPPSILDLIHARVDGLEEADRELLDVAACQGFQFDPRLVIDALGLPRIPALKRLARLERERRLIRSAGQGVSFDHHQLQEALYEALPVALRQAYHAALADVLLQREEAAGRAADELRGAGAHRLCNHLLAGAREKQALLYLDAALDHLDACYLPEAAWQLAQIVLDVTGLLVGSRRRAVLMRGAQWLQLSGRPGGGEALEQARSLADAADELVPRAQVRTALAMHGVRTARYADAERWAEEAEGLATEAGDRLQEGKAVGIRGTACMRQGRSDEAQALFERHIAIAREIEDGPGEARALGGLAILSGARGDHLSAGEYDRRALELTRRHAMRYLEATITGNLGISHFHRGEHEEAQALYERHLELARELGDREGEARVLGNLGALFEATGRHGRALECAELHLARCREIGYRRGELIAHINLGQLYADLGDAGASADHLTQARDGARTANAPDVEGNALLGLGILATRASAYGEARDQVEASSAIWQRIGDRESDVRILLALAAILEAQGHTEESMELLLEARDAARSVGAVQEEILALCRRAPGPGGDVVEATEALAAGEGRIAVVAACEARFLLWRATRRLEHLEAARSRLDSLVENARETYRESMLENVPLYSDIVKAWEAHDPDPAKRVDPATRVTWEQGGEAAGR